MGTHTPSSFVSPKAVGAKADPSMSWISAIYPPKKSARFDFPIWCSDVLLMSHSAFWPSSVNVVEENEVTWDPLMYNFRRLVSVDWVESKARTTWYQADVSLNTWDVIKVCWPPGLSSRRLSSGVNRRQLPAPTPNSWCTEFGPPGFPSPHLFTQADQVHVRRFDALPGVRRSDGESEKLKRIDWSIS